MCSYYEVYKMNVSICLFACLISKTN